MTLAFDLEVDVNGEAIFFVNKGILCSFSGRLTKILSGASATPFKRPLKIIFHDLPGGAEAFELFTRFCYNNGRIQITPINTCLLFFIAQSMEVIEEDHYTFSLIKQIEKGIEGIPHWSWPEIQAALKQCRNSFPLSNSSGILDKVLDSLVTRIASASDSSPSSCSPDSSVLRISFDRKSNLSTKNGNQGARWFEDIADLNVEMIDKVVIKMIAQKVDHHRINRFLFYYLKCKYSSNLSSDEKKNMTETVINHLYSLHRNSVSCKSLFDILRISSSQNLNDCCRERLEKMIGSRIDQATLDDLLISSPIRTDSLYDVNILLRFLRHFVNGGQMASARLKKVAGLLDLYMAEVAPDIFLKHSKFVALITAIPDTARDSHDSMYRAIDMYIEVHNGLTEAEKMKICCAINNEKLSLETCKHMAQNWKLPSRTAMQALLHLQSNLQGLQQESDSFRFFNGERNRSKDVNDIVLYAKKKVDPLMENEKLRAHLHGMQWRVMELEEVCRKMQSQMAKMMKTKKSSQGSMRSLPRLCS